MKKITFFFIVVVSLCFTAFLSCKSSGKNEANKDSAGKEEVSQEPQIIEETIDSAAIIDSLKK